MSKKPKDKSQKREWQLSIGRLSFSISYQRPEKKAKKPKTKRQFRLLQSIKSNSIIPMVMLAFGVTGLVFYAATIVNNSRPEPIELKAVYSPAAPEAIQSRPNGLPRSEPTRLQVPAIDIDTKVMKVGQAEDKTIEVPPLFENVTGWYELGPSPGEVGPAIIVGHVDTYKGPSVFWNLRNLKKGDKITVTRKDGKKVKFKVDGVEQFDQKKFPTEKVYGNIDYVGLRLVTCGGTFNQQSQRYSHNTVVFASKI